VPNVDLLFCCVTEYIELSLLCSVLLARDRVVDDGAIDTQKLKIKYSGCVDVYIFCILYKYLDNYFVQVLTSIDEMIHLLLGCQVF